MIQTEPVHRRGTDHAEITIVIKTESLAGTGASDDPYYTCVQYWDLNGRLLATSNPPIVQQEDT